MGSRLRSELGQELTLVVVMVSWAGNFIVTKAALAHVPPVAYQFVAFAVGSIALLCISQAIYRQVPPRFLLLQMALLGALGVGLNQLLFASGLAATTAGNAALLVATVPLFALLVSSAIGEEHMSWPAVGGTLLSLVGVAIVMGTGLSVVVGGHLRGDLLELQASLAVHCMGIRHWHAVADACRCGTGLCGQLA